jgi:hypothetical protein
MPAWLASQRTSLAAAVLLTYMSLAAAALLSLMSLAAAVLQSHIDL